MIESSLKYKEKKVKLRRKYSIKIFFRCWVLWSEEKKDLSIFRMKILLSNERESKKQNEWEKSKVVQNWKLKKFFFLSFHFSLRLHKKGA